MYFCTYFAIFSNFVFMPRDQMTGGILFVSCLSVVNIITFAIIFLTICDRDFIWHAYSTNKALSNDSDIHSENTFLGLCCCRGGGAQCFRVCAEFAISPKISNFAPFRLSSMAYIFSKIVNHHCINGYFLRFLHRSWLLNPIISNCEHIQLSIITNIFIRLSPNPVQNVTDASRNMDYFPISCHFCTEFDFPQKIFNVGSILLCITANICCKSMNYHSAIFTTSRFCV